MPECLESYSLFSIFLFAATISTIVVVLLTSDWSAIRISGSLYGSLASATVVIVFSHRKKNRITLALQALGAATEKECDVIRNEKKNLVTKEDRQTAESTANALAEHDKKIKDARLTKNEAMAYIKTEYQTFDTHLCQCLDKFQLLVNTWATENTADVLGGNQVKNFSRNGERIGPHLIQVGTVGIWDLFKKKAGTDQADTEAVKSTTMLQLTKRATVAQADMGAVKTYLKTLAKTIAGNTEAQYSLGMMYENGKGMAEDDSEAVKWYRKAAEQGHSIARLCAKAITLRIEQRG